MSTKSNGARTVFQIHSKLFLPSIAPCRRCCFKKVEVWRKRTNKNNKNKTLEISVPLWRGTEASRVQIQVTTTYQHFKYNAYISLIATLMKPLVNSVGRKSIDRCVHATTIQKLNAKDMSAACRTKPF